MYAATGRTRKRKAEYALTLACPSSAAHRRAVNPALGTAADDGGDGGARKVSRVALAILDKRKRRRCHNPRVAELEVLRPGQCQLDPRTLSRFVAIGEARSCFYKTESCVENDFFTSTSPYYHPFECPLTAGSNFSSKIAHRLSDCVACV